MFSLLVRFLLFFVMISNCFLRCARFFSFSRESLKMYKGICLRRFIHSTMSVQPRKKLRKWFLHCCVIFSSYLFEDFWLRKFFWTDYDWTITVIYKWSIWCFFSQINYRQFLLIFNQLQFFEFFANFFFLKKKFNINKVSTLRKWRES